METVKVILREKRGRKFEDREIEIPTDAEMVRVALQLHAARSRAVRDILGWRVIYEPSRPYRYTKYRMDPFTAERLSEDEEIESRIVAWCTFGHEQSWGVTFSWANGDDEPPVRCNERGHVVKRSPSLQEPLLPMASPPADYEEKVDIAEQKQEFAGNEYVAALRGLQLSPHHLRMLQAHYHAPNRTLTATQMSGALGYSGYRVANLHYGRLGHLVGQKLAWTPLPEQTVAVLCTFEKSEREWHWTMRPALALALEQLGWVGGASSEIPQEIVPTVDLYEGAVKTITVNAYERSAVAREKCILHYGCACSACGLRLAEKYGDVAQGLIHVHHVRPLADVNAEYQVDPIRDLRPLCPTCHAVIHTKIPPFTVDEIRAMIEKQRTPSPA